VSDGEQDERQELFGIERRKALIGLGLALALTLGAVAVIGEVTSYGELLTALRRADKSLLPLTLVGELVAYAGYLVAYRSVASVDGGPRLRYRDAGQVITLGMGAYVVGSDAGGLTVDFWAMREAGSKTHEAARRTLALNTLQAAALAWLATIAGVVLLARGAGGAALVLALIWVLAPPVLSAAAAAASSNRFAPRLLEPPDESRRRLYRKVRKALGDAIGGVVFTRHVLSHPRRYLGGVLGYPLFWIGDFFILWISLRAFGFHLDPARLVVAEATAWALNFVPLPGGGAGFSEAAMAYTLHAVGVPLSQAIFAALVYRAVNFWLPLVPALALLPRVGRLQESLRRAEHTEPDEDAHLHGDFGLPKKKEAA
jgi:uncharacterized protein (TIRG00374 family)